MRCMKGSQHHSSQILLVYENPSITCTMDRANTSRHRLLSTQCGEMGQFTVFTGHNSQTGLNHILLSKLINQISAVNSVIHSTKPPPASRLEFRPQTLPKGEGLGMRPSRLEPSPFVNSSHYSGSFAEVGIRVTEL